MITVEELKALPTESSAEIIIKNLETQIIAARHTPDCPNSRRHVVGLPWSYSKKVTNAVMWELLEAGYDVKFYHCDGGLRIHIEYYI